MRAKWRAHPESLSRCFFGTALPRVTLRLRTNSFSASSCVLCAFAQRRYGTTAAVAPPVIAAALLLAGGAMQ